MIILIGGPSHTGKTNLSYKLISKYHFPMMSIDHLKMGLIRSKNTTLTPQDDSEMEAYLWPIIKEIVRTAIENKQDLIIEGAYIPTNWMNSFSETELRNIRTVFLVMSTSYIESHFDDIIAYKNVAENRIGPFDVSLDMMVEEHHKFLESVRSEGSFYILIHDEYDPLKSFEKFFPNLVCV